MEWIYFDNMIPIHAREPSIENQLPVIMSVIKSFLLF